MIKIKYAFLSAIIVVLFGCTETTKSTSPAATPAVPAAETPKDALPPVETLPPAPGEDDDKKLVELEDEDIVADPLLKVDLLHLQKNEAAKLSTVEIREKNNQTIDNLKKLPIRKLALRARGRNRVQTVEPKVVQQIIDSMNIHPIVSSSANGKYERPGTEIGYCFGRATYAHLALLKIGVDKDSIRKIWLVGPMVTNRITWQFHVAVTVRTTDGKWMVVDNFTGKLLEISDWVNFFYKYNAKPQKLRVYITSPSKFSVSLASYNPIQLGLNVSSEVDWYRHYFFDLMKWFQKNDMSQFGLSMLHY